MYHVISFISNIDTGGGGINTKYRIPRLAYIKHLLLAHSSKGITRIHVVNNLWVTL